MPPGMGGVFSWSQPVGADAPVRPPGLAPTPCKKPCHCEPVTDVTGVAIRSPRPLRWGITDSHDQSADWSRNDTQVLSASVIARALRAPQKSHIPVHKQIALEHPVIQLSLLVRRAAKGALELRVAAEHQGPPALGQTPPNPALSLIHI